MNSSTHAAKRVDWHRVQQMVKWLVYSLLLVNWVFYMFEDANRAFHVLTPQSTFLEWTREFATSIDESAWFILLFMLELETYILEDNKWDGWVGKTVRGVRMVCFVMIAHTVFANTTAVKDQLPTIAYENANSLCDLVGQDLSYVYNLEYTEVNEQTCGTLTDATTLYKVGKDPIVSNLEGLELERKLAWADLFESICWVLVILTIELLVRLTDKEINSGKLYNAANRGSLFFYSIIVLVAIYWATLGHWLYVWDEFLWIAGFVAIEMNVSEWRDELIEDNAVEAVEI